MLAFLQSLINILLFRAGPQDIPSSRYLLKATALASLLAATATSVGMLNLGVGQALITAVSKLAVYSGVIFLLLKSGGKPERWVQTMTALLGVLAITNVLSIPFLPELQEVEEGKYVIVPGYGVMIVAAIEIWFLAVLVRTLRDAMEIRVGQAILLTILLIIVETVALSSLSNTLGIRSESVIVGIGMPEP